MAPCIDIYTLKTQRDGNIDNLKLIIVVRRDLQNKELFIEALSPTASIGTLKYLFEYNVKNKARVHQLHFIEALL